MACNFGFESLFLNCITLKTLFCHCTRNSTQIYMTYSRWKTNKSANVVQCCANMSAGNIGNYNNYHSHRTRVAFRKLAFQLNLDDAASFCQTKAHKKKQTNRHIFIQIWFNFIPLWFGFLYLRVHFDWHTRNRSSQMICNGPNNRKCDRQLESTI